MSLYKNFQALPATNRPISAHMIHYHPDGTARDTYISLFNGGLYSKDLIQKIQPKQQKKYQAIKQKNHSIDTKTNLPKIVHYRSDGSGRDYYISKNDGGQTNYSHWSQHSDYQFVNSLRNWSQTPKNGLPQLRFDKGVQISDYPSRNIQLNQRKEYRVYPREGEQNYIETEFMQRFLFIQ